MVNSSRGGGSKDTWVLVPPGEAEYPAPGRPGVGGRRRAHRWWHLPASSRGPGRPGERAAHGRPAMTTGLLSRIAETLFWTGRYIERADDTARMVDVYVHRMLEEPHTDQEADCRALLAVLGMPAADGARLDIGMTLDQSAYDQENPSAIAGSVMAARRGARSVREVISSEMWECLNVTGHGLARGASPRSGSAPCLPGVHPGAGRPVLRPGRVDHEPRRGLAVPGPRPQPGAGGHDRPAAAGPDAGHPVRGRLADAAPRLRRLRVLHPHPDLDRRPAAGGRVPADGPAVPAVRGARAGHRGGSTRRARPGGRRLSPTDPARRSIGQLRTRLEYADPQQLPGLLPDLLAPCSAPAGRPAKRSPPGTSSTSSP